MRPRWSSCYHRGVALFCCWSLGLLRNPLLTRRAVPDLSEPSSTLQSRNISIKSVYVAIIFHHFFSQGDVPRFAKAPWKISFIPNTAFSCSSTVSKDLSVKLAAIAAGSVIYTEVLHQPDYIDFDPAKHNPKKLSPERTEAVEDVANECPYVASTHVDTDLLF